MSVKHRLQDAAAYVLMAIIVLGALGLGIAARYFEFWLFWSATP